MHIQAYLYLGPDHTPHLFRLDLNIERMVRSAERVALPVSTPTPPRSTPTPHISPLSQAIRYRHTADVDQVPRHARGTLHPPHGRMQPV